MKHCSGLRSSYRSLSSLALSLDAGGGGSSSLGVSQGVCLQTWQPGGESSSGNRSRSGLAAEMI